MWTVDGHHSNPFTTGLVRGHFARESTVALVIFHQAHA